VKISEIKNGDTSILGGKLTFVLSLDAQRTIERIAGHKSLTPSELLREIVDGFILENKEEIKAL
jgi:hypothetical protein